MEEEWRPVVGFERYAVSNMGNVRRGMKLLTPCLDTDGYRQVNLYAGGKRTTRKVYRLMMDAFCPNTEDKPCIDHINRVRTDDRLENLRWATSSENARNRPGIVEDMIGIGWSKKNSTYMVRLAVDGSQRYYGSRKTIEDAKALRDDVLAGHVDFTPNRDRDTYGISLLSRGFYQVRVNRKTIGYRKTFEDAKHLRDEHTAIHNHEGHKF